MFRLIKRKIAQYINNRFVRPKRLRGIARLPSTVLADKHIADCRLVTDREVMLQRLGQFDCAVELGVNKGDFSQKILEICKPNKLYLVDIWGSERYHDGLFNDVQKKFEDRINGGGVIIHRKLSTVAASDFDESSIDFLYIDTDHSYSTTKEELIRYESKMTTNGVIAGHDFVAGNWVTGFKYGVIEAVYEFCVKHNWRMVYLTMNTRESISFALKKII
jgi:hypothetical protein